MAILVVLVFASLSFYSLSVMNADEAPPSPPNDAPPPSPVDVAPEPGNGIPLWLPLEARLELPIADGVYTVPAGATATWVIGEPPSNPDGPPGGDAAFTHLNFWRISRGESEVKIDTATGEVFDYNVAPEDVPDFEASLSPKPPSGAGR